MSLFAEPPLEMGWWMHVENTYCSNCKKMTDAGQYQGHFNCSKCGELTGFWFPMVMWAAPVIGEDIEGVKTWNKDGTRLEIVPFKLRGEDFIRTSRREKNGRIA